MTGKAKADEAPRQAALALLPLLLSNPPFIPASSTSISLNRRHQILESSPEDVEEYLVTDTYPTDFSTATRSVELLQTLTSLVEEQGASVVGRIQFKCPERDEILIGVELGDEMQSVPPLLLLLLKLEGDKKDSDSYKYDNLLPMNVVPGPWFERIEDAVNFRKTATEMTERLSRAFPEDVVNSRKNSGTPLDVLHAHHDRNGGDMLLPAEAEAQGGGEYIIDANEFWEGFGSDGDELVREIGDNKDSGVIESHEDRQKRLQEEEDRYWEMYDQTGASTAGQAQTEASQTSRREGVFSGKEHLKTVPGDQERLNVIRTRNDAVKLMLKDAWRVMLEANGGLESSRQIVEKDFFELAREAVKEIQLEMSAI